MNKTLLAITTFNQWEYTSKMLESIILDKDRIYDVILVDDCSTDGTVEIAKKHGVPIITKPVGRGSTDSWNLAYQYFRFSEYDNLFIANNDCIIPKGCMNELIENIEDNCLTIPLSGFNGSGDNKNCTINTYHKINLDADKPENTQEIQDIIIKSKKEPMKKKIDWAAFIFGFNKTALLKERFGNLFTPYNINIHQERELKDIFTIKIVPTAFAFHFKAKTLKDTDNSRNDLRLLHEGYKTPTEGILAIKWRKTGKVYTIDNVFAYPFTLMHVMMLLSRVMYTSSQRCLEDVYGESSDCDIDV